MEKFSIATIVIRITNFIFTFVQRAFSVYYYWFLDRLGEFLQSWFNFSEKNVQNSTFDSDLQTNQCLEADASPKYVSIPLTEDIDVKTLKKEGISVWRAKDVRELARVSNRSSIAEKTQNELWLKIQEIAQYKKEDTRDLEVAQETEEQEIVNGDNKITEINEITKITEQKKFNYRYKSNPKEFISGTNIKLEAYNKRNRDYLLSKYTHGPAVDNFVFTHPNTKSTFSGNAYFLLKNPQPRGSKKRPPPFRPTELSTIFENLAY